MIDPRTVCADLIRWYATTGAQEPFYLPLEKRDDTQEAVRILTTSKDYRELVRCEWFPELKLRTVPRLILLERKPC